ncbi:MAG: sigma-54-dependent Fis family transcriptional regulator, partial [Rhodobacteraceae bacterium]|nr:sigma-54-dependent Fis family transcriptional regulator [Paracoccaceae bacterium]
ARVVNADLPLLITGESGAGKTALARAIHDLSDRRTRPLVSVGAGDLGAPEAVAGVLARAGGGTLVLEEIADFPPHAQAHAVRLFEGAPDPAPRIVATTQADAAARMAAGTLRDDLYYRLSGAVLAMPPVRERVDDIPLLASHFLARAAREGAAQRHLSEDALTLVRAYSWPGNVRQIEHTMRRLALTGPGPEIGRAEVEQVLGAMPAGAPLREGGGSDDRLSASVARHLRRHFDLHGGALPPPGLYGRVLREIEAPLIEIALEATGGNQARCADLLGINRNTLRKKITDLDIRVTRRRKLM